MKYRKHVFICVNQKAEGKQCCGEKRGMELVQAFKDSLKSKGLQLEIRAQRTGCLDACSFGSALVVYPEGTYYGHVQLSDVEDIVQNHLINNQPVESLVLQY
jgi:(2Fe-2S) ferredoxin